MSLEDYLIPGEEIRFQSGVNNVSYGGKKYNLILTTKRVLLHSNRGLMKRDDIVTLKLEEIQSAKYKETGLVKKNGVIEVQGKTLVQITGGASQLKTLYQQLMQFL